MLSADKSSKYIFFPAVINVALIHISESVKLVCGMKENILINKMMTIVIHANWFDIIKLMNYNELALYELFLTRIIIYDF